MRTLPLIGKRPLLVLIAVLFAAWFDGGEEPLHRIEQSIPVPERNE